MARLTREQVRQDALQEIKEDREYELVVQTMTNKWRHRTLVVGAFFVANVLAVIPFLKGHSLHRHWDPIGIGLTYLAMGLLAAFASVAGTYVSFWFYLRTIRKTHRKYGPHFDPERVKIRK